jgi:hypothetical protein
LEAALRDTCLQGAVPIFVYANEAAMSEPMEPLSDALKVSPLAIVGPFRRGADG